MGCPGGMSTIQYTLSVFTFVFRAIFLQVSLEEGKKKDRCAVFGYNIDHLFFREMYSEVLFLPEKRA